jgi:hypothetical protein
MQPLEWRDAELVFTHQAEKDGKGHEKVTYLAVFAMNTITNT